VTSGIIPSPYHALLSGYAALAILAGTLLFLTPPPRTGTGEAGADLTSVVYARFGGTTDTAAFTSSTGSPAVPQCAPELSLAGRELVIDPAATPHLGTLQFPDAQPLAEKEVLLTFDDGPHPHRTAVILDILDRFCVKAVFFIVGEMALEHGDVLREVARRGHVIGTHSYSHPRSLARMGPQRARDEIERGFAAVAHALGGPVAPLFRFPGFNQDGELLAYLAEKKVSVWSVDVVSGDSEFVGSQHLPGVMFRRLAAHGRGMILFHDIKKMTADRLPDILARLKEEGYSAVRPSVPAVFAPDEAMVATLNQGKPQWQAPVRRAAEKSGSARVAVRSSGRPQRARRALPEFQEQ
jgi:peptidoglycan/xylan/chitin deacetylase (PgdA/CDA1 family)